MNISVSEKINREMLNKVKQIDEICFENTDFYNQYTRALSETGNRVNEVLNTFCTMIMAILNVAVIISLLFTIDPLFIAFGVIASIISFAQGMIFSKIAYKENYESTPFVRRQNYMKRIMYSNSNSKDIKFYPQFSDVLQKHHSIGTLDRIKSVQKYGRKKFIIQELFGLCELIFENVFPWIFIAVRTYTGTISFGSAAAIFNATNQLPSMLKLVLGVIPQFNHHSLFISNLRNILEYKSKIETNNGIIQEKEKFSIKMENVTFSYDCSPALKGIDIEFQPGGHYAIVGLNGSGKTTLSKMIVRFFDPSKGRIWLDDKRITDFNVESYRRRFSVCFQDFNIYAMTIAENVLMREIKTETDRDRVVSALKQVGMVEKVLQLPYGIDTFYSKEFYEEGCYFSGGELQKLALARALASDASVFIFDEPSSALDPIAEHEINKTIFSSLQGKTVIIISHRLSTTIDADKIFYMEDGLIVESGTHNELLQQQGKYAEMFSIQAEKYKK